MTTVVDALNLIENHCTTLALIDRTLLEARGFILGKDVFAPINMPPFRQSAMDGYALQLSSDSTYTLIEESKAGDDKNIQLQSGEAVRIFTGAIVPDNADTVVMQEHVVRTNNKIALHKSPEKFANIRPIGEQVKKDDLVLKKGTLINEAAIGFLAGMGINKITVHKAPSVVILSTGNELQEAGSKLKPGAIYESNSFMLKAALQRIGIDIKDITVLRVKDDYSSTVDAIKKAINKADVLLISGGISVGDYDFVKEALTENNVTEIFYKVNQKPGKPFYFGKKQDKSIFALPGNPASSLTCFYVYVLPALRKMMGHTNAHLKKVKAKSAQPIMNPTGKALFLKAKVINDVAHVLTGQASSMLNSYAISNALVYIPEEKEKININEEVECLNLIF